MCALERRRVSASGIRDFFDLADTLLSPDSLQHCLTRLDRRSLAALIHLSTSPASTDAILKKYEVDATVLHRLQSLFLVRDTPDGLSAWPAVGTQLAQWPALGLADPLEETPEPGDSAPGDSADGGSTHGDNTQSETEQLDAEALAAERAFTATNATAELLFALEREPLKLLATGAVGRPGARKLAELLRVNETDVTTYIDIAEHAGLTARIDGKLFPSESHRDWLEQGPAERWVSIADAWAETHWPDIRARIGRRPSVFRTGMHDTGVPRVGPHTTGLHAWLEWNYPGGRDWLPEHVSKRLGEAEMLGITASVNISTPGAHLLIGEIATATALLAATLPTPISRLYLQDDLTAVAPGPLEPLIDTRLRTMANVDGHAIASRYRFTSASITRAISGSETSASILEFLESVTLSGIPQPLEYLVAETASRHGLLRVGTLTDDGPQSLAYIRSDDAVLLRTVLIDRNLAALRLRPAGDERLVSACDRDQLYSVLFRAKYPVAIEDSRGRIVSDQTEAAARGTAAKPATTPRPRPHQALVNKLRVADAEAPEDSGEAWLARQLESAIRSKSTVTVSVRMPNGKVLDYRLEPAAISRGRLRARDALSEIERTLPLSSIVAVLED